MRTTDPLGSTFSTLNARTKQTKDAGSPRAGLAIAFKLVVAAEIRWRRVNAPHLVALVWAGVEFADGEAGTFRSDPTPADLFTHTVSVFAAKRVPIHKIRQYLLLEEHARCPAEDGG